MRCRKYEARLEDYIGGLEDRELSEHLQECARCQAAVEDAQLAGSWLRQAWEPAGEARPEFLAGAMARIREQQLKAESVTFWSPLEFMASRLSLTAAVLLLLVSGYLLESNSRRVLPPPAQPSFSAEDMPQPPADPANNEEVLQSLAERSYGQ